jgi:hypothetical protein
MSYTKRDDIPVGTGEIAVELDTGDLVAVGCNRKRVDYGVCYHATARAINVDGTARTYPTGALLQTAMKHSVSVDRVDTLTDDAIARECMFAVLGEPLAGLFAWSDVNLSAWSIRVSISAAQVSGDADAGAVL